jgi:hypothetical protein
VPRSPRSPFVTELRAMAKEDGNLLGSDDRAEFARLAGNPDIEQVWTKIEKYCEKQSVLVMRFFIREMLGARRLAAGADDWPEYLKHAKQAESLAKFLKGSGRLPPPLPMIALPEFVTKLENVASMMRHRAEMSRVHKSRQNIDGSRQYILFMRLMSLQMQELFGAFFDHEVAELTNILFARASATTESVRAARRPTTRKGRQGQR